MRIVASEHVRQSPKSIRDDTHPGSIPRARHCAGSREIIRVAPAVYEAVRGLDEASLTRRPPKRVELRADMSETFGENADIVAQRLDLNAGMATILLGQCIGVAAITGQPSRNSPRRPFRSWSMWWCISLRSDCISL
jgi:hypothetical protein